MRTDQRLSFVGTLARGRASRGTLTFSMPPLDVGTYELASWSRGRGLSVQRSARLRLATTSPCPVTLPNGNRPPGQPRDVPWYGNGLLWAGLEPDGTSTVPAIASEPTARSATSCLWVTTPPWEKPTVYGERIDAAAAPLPRRRG